MYYTSLYLRISLHNAFYVLALVHGKVGDSNSTPRMRTPVHCLDIITFRRGYIGHCNVVHGASNTGKSTLLWQFGTSTDMVMLIVE